MSHDSTPPPMPGHVPPMPPHPSQPPGPPRPPGGNRTNLVIVGCAVAVVASVIGTGVVVMNDGDATASPAPTVTVTKTVASEDADTTGDDNSDSDGSGSDGSSGTEDSSDGASDGASDTATDDDGVFALDDTVVYESDVEVSLAGFRRGVSSAYASPENTPYAKFTIKIINNSDVTVDANEMTVDCAYGDEGKEGEGIYDDGLDGLPDTRILAGRSLTVPWACELPKNETFLQVEVSPDYDSEEAIFTGDVKK